MASSGPFKAPVVSSLSVRVVVDSVFDQFMPKATHPVCTIEHVGRIRNRAVKSPPIARFVADSPLEEADLPPMIKRKIGAAPRW
jgi:hypothetical protein